MHRPPFRLYIGISLFLCTSVTFMYRTCFTLVLRDMVQPLSAKLHADSNSPKDCHSIVRTTPPTKHRHSYNFQTINLSPCVLFHSTCESGSEALWLDCRSADLPDKCLFHRLHNNKSIRRRSGWAIRRYKNHITDSRSNGRLIRNDPKDQHLRLLPTLCPQNRAGLHWGTPRRSDIFRISCLLTPCQLF